MNLPDQVIEAFQQGKRYFSWVDSLEVTDFPTDWQLAYQLYINSSSLTRFFWSTPDKSTILIGLDSVLTCVASKENSQRDLLEMIQARQIELAKNCYQSQNLSATGFLFLGGFPFDKNQSSDNYWGKLGHGYFFVPKILLSKRENQWYISFNAHVTSLQELNEAYMEKNSNLNKWQVLFEQKIYVLHNQNKTNLENKFEQKNKLQSKITLELEETFTDWQTRTNLAIQQIKNQTSSLRKVVLARRLFLKSSTPLVAEQVLKNLLKQQNQVYIFLLQVQQKAFIGATPERLLSGNDYYFATSCIAGSAPRGITTVADEQLATALLKDQKNIQEHQIVVQRIQTQLLPFVDKIETTETRHILKNRDIQHLYIPICGRRKEGSSLLTVLKALHPTPALGGEPKDEALNWLTEHEKKVRGMYGAPVGWFNPVEDVGEFAVGIRSSLLTKQVAVLYAGCGIVADSIAQSEWDETKTKFQPMIRGILGNESR